MRHTSIDVNRLKEAVSLRYGARASDKDQDMIAAGRMQVTRRQLLGAMGAAVVSQVPVMRGLSSEETNTVRIRRGPKHVAFLVDGVEKWRVDARRFSGSPVLAFDESGQRTTVRLQNAFYPGTSVPADMTCELTRGSSAWKMKLRLALGGFSCSMPFERWLSGVQQAESWARLNHLVCRPDSSSELCISGRAYVGFSPDWTLMITGISAATMKLGDTNIESDAVSVRLLSSSDSSIMKSPATRRTLVILRNGKQSWNMSDMLPSLDEWEISQGDAAFDTMRVECGENRRGSSTCAWLAESSDSADALCVKPRADSDFCMPLRKPQLARAYSDGTLRHSALTAGYGSSTFAGSRSCVLKLGDSLQAPPFEFSHYSGQRPTASCTPAVLAISILFTSAITAVSAEERTIKISLTSENSEETVAETVDWFGPDAKDGLIALDKVAVQVTRPDDMLTLKFEFQNCVLTLHSNKLRPAAGKDSYMIVRFPPQHIAEQCIDVDSPVPTPVPSIMAGESRLVFQVTGEIDFTLDGLLDWNGERLELSLAPLPAADSVPQELDDTLTSIEAPYRLMLAPDGPASSFRWDHSQPYARGDNDYCELWHTRLATSDHTEGRNVQIRAVCSPDAGDEHATTPQTYDVFFMQPAPLDRHSVVHLTSDPAAKHSPKSMEAEQFFLSSLGAWIRMRGDWSDDSFGELSLIKYIHHMVMGRDTYVELVDKGFLYPYRHRAVKIRIVKRRFTDPGGPRRAYLEKREFIAPVDREVDYDPDQHQFQACFPFQKVRIDTDRVEVKGKFAIDGLGTDQVFWPCVDRECGSKIVFQMTGTDRSGRHVEFTQPLIFVVANAACFAPKNLATIATAYAASGDRKVDAKGQSVCFVKEPDATAKDTGGQADSTVYGTDYFIPAAIAVGGEHPLYKDQISIKPSDSFPSEVQTDYLKKWRAPFYPIVEEAGVKAAVVQQLTGQTAPVPINYAKPFAEFGLDSKNNVGKVFANIKDASSVSFAKGVVGGAVAPDLIPQSIAVGWGVMGGTAESVAKGIFDPKEYLKDAKILGGISLASILDQFPFNKANVPQLALLRSEKDVTAQMHWVLDNAAAGNDKPIKSAGIFSARPDTKLDITLSRSQKLGSAETHENFAAAISSFSINLLSLVEVDFASLGITRESGKKPNVQPRIAGIRFGDALSFVQGLSESLKTTGGLATVTPFMDVDADAIKSGFCISVSDIPLGGFSLRNLSFTAGVNLSLTGRPVELKLDFCRRDRPFLVTVSYFGGGGFLGMSLTPEGVKSIECAIEFGAYAQVDVLNVLHGMACIMAGIYYKKSDQPALVTGQDGTTTPVSCSQDVMEGYVRCVGQLTALKLITISAELYVSVSSEQGGGNKVTGSADYVMSVRIWRFTKSVPFKVSYAFTGGGGTQHLTELSEPATPALEKQHWERYWSAFEHEEEI